MEGKKWRFVEILRAKTEFANRHFLPPNTTDSLCHSDPPTGGEESPVPLIICLHLLRHKVTNQWRREEPSYVPEDELKEIKTPLRK